jgi:hypothetical protein
MASKRQDLRAASHPTLRRPRQCCSSSRPPRRPAPKPSSRCSCRISTDRRSSRTRTFQWLRLRRRRRRLLEFRHLLQRPSNPRPRRRRPPTHSSAFLSAPTSTKRWFLSYWMVRLCGSFALRGIRRWPPLSSAHTTPIRWRSAPVDPMLYFHGLFHSFDLPRVSPSKLRHSFFCFFKGCRSWSVSVPPIRSSFWLRTCWRTTRNGLGAPPLPRPPRPSSSSSNRRCRTSRLPALWIGWLDSRSVSGEE